MRDRFFSLIQQASESTALFVICMEQEHMCLVVDIATTYHAFVSKLDINILALLDNVQVNKRVGGGGSLTWADVVAIYRD